MQRCPEASWRMKSRARNPPRFAVLLLVRRDKARGIPPATSFSGSLHGPGGASSVDGVGNEPIPSLEEHNDRSVPGALVWTGDRTSVACLTARTYFGGSCSAHGLSLRVRSCVPTVPTIKPALTNRQIGLVSRLLYQWPPNPGIHRVCDVQLFVLFPRHSYVLLSLSSLSLSTMRNRIAIEEIEQSAASPREPAGAAHAFQCCAP